MRMKTAVALIALLATLGAALDGRSAEPTFCTLGEDRLEFPKEFVLANEQERQWRKQDWAPNDEVRKYLGANSPFRADVEFGRPDMGCSHWVRERDVYAKVSWSSIGYFLKPITSPEQFEAVLSVLHTEWPRERLTNQQRGDIFHEIESSGKSLPLKILKKDIDADTVSKGSFRKDGIWVSDLVLIEDASVVEYKYAMNRQNRLAMVRHVLVQGPPYPWSRWVQQGLVPLYHTPEKQQEGMDQYRRSRGVLLRVAWMNQWRKALRDPDKRVRRENVWKFRELREEAKDATPDLRMVLKDADGSVRSAAEEVLGEIGSVAVPELRKAMHDVDKNVRESALSAMAHLGPAGKEAVPDLLDAARKPDSHVWEIIEGLRATAMHNWALRKLNLMRHLRWPRRPESIV